MGAPVKTVAVIMAGGSGTRFWPMSRPDYPKQFLSLWGDRSLIRETADRIRSVVDETFLCSAASQSALLRKEIPEISSLVLEPEGKNTAPCLMLSLAHLLQRGFSDDSVMVVLPADHYISDVASFHSTLKKAIALAKASEGLVTMGIRPTSPHTGYGYIESDGQKVKRFIEKPDLARAKEFTSQKQFLWNSGMFVWTLGALKKAFERFAPDDWNLIGNARTADSISAVYKKVKAAPIDTAVMEKADNVFVVPSDFGWSDIGSWNALHELKAKSASENVVLSGDVKAIDSKGCLVSVSGKKVALVGVDNLIVVESGDTLLIVPRSQDQKVKDASKLFD